MGIVSALPTLLTAVLDLVMGLLGAIITNLPLIIEAGIQLLLSLVTGLIGALPQLITAAINLVLQLVVGLLTMLPQLIEAGIQLVVSLIVGLVQAIPQIIEMMPQIIEAIWEGLAGVDWLDLGAQIIQGVIDGFFSMVGAVGDAVGEVVGGILDFFPHSPAKKGPLSSAGWRQLKTSGAATMAQFIDGADGQAPAFGDALADAATAASTKAQAAMSSVSAEVSASVASRGAPAPSAPTGAAAEGTGRSATVNVYPTPGMSEETIGRVAVDSLNFELRGL
jgi:phage-related protein